MLASPPAAVTIPESLVQALELQRRAYHADPVPSAAQRKKDLEQIIRFLKDNRDDIAAAISQDYGHRSKHETLFAEIFSVIDMAKDAKSKVRRWMRPQQRHVDPMNFLGASNTVVPQPLGVVGAIVPWNFPINLSFGALVSVFAAGNRAMVKMSENSRHLTRLIQSRIGQYFPPEKLVFFEETGGVGVAFSQLKFDHLLFTGSGQTGRAVMASAAANLVPVTLELGGKSPAVVCDDFPLAKAVERIMFVKCFNGGQICTTVDYTYVPRAKVQAFVDEARRVVKARFGSLASPDLTSIIDDKSFARITQAMEAAEAKGATLVPLLDGPRWDAATRKIAPHIVLNAPPSTELRCREIFGPVLPLIPYDSLTAVVDEINAGDRPLAFYPFSYDQRTTRMLIDHVMSGGVSVNDALFHVAQHDMPFGGVGESGMGHYHGREGFITFSKLRPIFHQARFSAASLMYPPYKTFATKYLDWLTK